eukprot:gene19435-25315_t
MSKSVGYKRYYDKLAIALDDEFPGLIDFSYTKDPGSTGNFEVKLVQTGELVHSKKRGQGRCETAQEVQAIIKKINEYLNS